MRREERYLKEKKYEESNKEYSSVCSGFHYIKQTHKYEKCKHCDMCYKYFMYKNQEKTSFTEVRFHYVDSFRECELWGQKIKESEANPKKTTVQKPKKSIDFYREGYKNISENHPQLLDYVTWNELFAICTLKFCTEQMDTAIRSSEMFKREFKKQYNLFHSRYRTYISLVYSRCFFGDNQIVEKEAETLSIDIMKFRLTIENYLHRFNVKHASEMSYIIVCNEMIDEVEILFRKNMAFLHKVDSRATIAPFMSSSCLMQPMTYLVRKFVEIDGIKEVIDLRKDFNVRNGLMALHNKLTNKDTINKIISKIDEFYINNKNK